MIDHDLAADLDDLAEAIARLKPISNRNPHAFYEDRSELASRARALAAQSRGVPPAAADVPAPVGRQLERKRVVHVEGRTVLVLERAVTRLASITALIATGLLLAIPDAPARDLDARYANSPLKSWFDGLKSKGGGPCCSDADGTALSDVDWETKDGRYRVRIDGEWIDVPEDTVITEPNRAGRTMVWPHYRDGKPIIRCFMPGSMT